MTITRATLLSAALIVTVGLYSLGLAEWSFIGDDAYISFRYARNLVDGHGLVFNPGAESVEGYTNLGWVLITAAGLAMGLSAEITAGTVGATSGVLMLLLLTAWNARRREWSDPTILAAPLLLASTRSWAAWSTSGLETMTYTLLLFAGMLMADHEHQRDDPLPWRSGSLLAAALLMRPDGLLFVGVLALSLVWDILQGRRSWEALGIWLTPIAVVVLGQQAFRMAYYGDWVPNTARVKVHGWRGEQGLAYLGVAHNQYGLGWVLPVAALPLALRRERVDVVFTASVLLHLAYLIAIGGDRFENRFLIPIAPLYAWLVVEGLGLAAERLPRGRETAVMTATLAMALTMRQASVRPRPPIVHGVEQVTFISKFAKGRAHNGRLLRSAIDRGLLPADIRLCVGAAGALPYFAKLWTLDFFGLNDREIALQEVRKRDEGITAHEKRASPKRLIDERIDLFDSSGDLFSTSKSGAVDAWERSQSKLRKMGGRKELRVECLRVDEQWLVFATTLSAEDHADRFGHLESCSEPIKSAYKARKARETR